MQALRQTSSAKTVAITATKSPSPLPFTVPRRTACSRSAGDARSNAISRYTSAKLRTMGCAAGAGSAAAPCAGAVAGVAVGVADVAGELGVAASVVAAGGTATAARDSRSCSGSLMAVWPLMRLLTCVKISMIWREKAGVRLSVCNRSDRARDACACLLAAQIVRGLEHADHQGHQPGQDLLSGTVVHGVMRAKASAEGVCTPSPAGTPLLWPAWRAPSPGQRPRLLRTLPWYPEIFSLLSRFQLRA